MDIRHVLCATLVGAALTACAKANASEFQPSNPLHCVAQFSTYALAARHQGDERLAQAFLTRSGWYADRARSLPAEQRTRDVTQRLINRIIAQPDGGAALAAECIKRQDSDPDWQGLTLKALRAQAEGYPSSTRLSQVH